MLFSILYREKRTSNKVVRESKDIPELFILHGIIGRVKVRVVTATIVVPSSIVNRSPKRTEMGTCSISEWKKEPTQMTQTEPAVALQPVPSMNLAMQFQQQSSDTVLKKDMGAPRGTVC
jgi:hypothetical protein